MINLTPLENFLKGKNCYVKTFPRDSPVLVNHPEEEVPGRPETEGQAQVVHGSHDPIGGEVFLFANFSFKRKRKLWQKGETKLMTADSRTAEEKCTKRIWRKRRDSGEKRRWQRRFGEKRSWQNEAKSLLSLGSIILLPPSGSETQGSLGAQSFL